MRTWDIERFVTSTVEALLPRNSNSENGLLMRLEFSACSHTDEDAFYAGCILELVFQRPSNYTKVFSRVLSKSGVVLKDWENTSNHDSCWRSDGLKDIFKLYIQTREDMERQNPKYDFRANEVSISPPTFGKYLQYVKIDMLQDMQNAYKYHLTSITPFEE